MKEKMIRMYNNTKNGVQKHSPEILAGVGVVGVVASTVMACKATMKLNKDYKNEYLTFFMVVG